MAMRRFSLLAVCIGTISFTAAAFSHAVERAVDFLAKVLWYAFPAIDFRDLIQPEQTPAVVGLHQARSYRERLLEHTGDGRRRATMSQAFAAAA